MLIIKCVARHAAHVPVGGAVARPAAVPPCGPCMADAFVSLLDDEDFHVVDQRFGKTSACLATRPVRGETRQWPPHLFWMLDE